MGIPGESERCARVLCGLERVFKGTCVTSVA